MIRRLGDRRCGRQIAPLVALTLLLCCLPVALSRTAGASGRGVTPLPATPTVPAGLLAAMARTGLAPRAVPAAQQQAELTPGDGGQGDFFGGALALSGDGTTALVGASFHDQNTGAAYVFARGAGGWRQQALLTASDGAARDFFGGALALSGDGGIAMVGASSHNHRTGATYVFVRRGTGWHQQAELTANDAATHDDFGRSIALARDGTTALVGADGQSLGTGAAYVFVRGGSGWGQQAELHAGNGAHLQFFGGSLALSGDGSVALVGAGGPNQLAGAAYIFVRSGTSWRQQAELTAAHGAPGDRFGLQTALSGTGSTALVGAFFRHQRTGTAYIFARTGTTWHQQAELTADDGAPGDQFGCSVALSGDGSSALVGAAGRNQIVGAAYVFVRGGSIWRQQAEFIADDSTSRDAFGSTVALSRDGRSALVGADGKQGFTGAAYVFVRDGTGWGP